jgi:hypothetical protein
VNAPFERCSFAELSGLRHGFHIVPDTWVTLPAFLRGREKRHRNKAKQARKLKVGIDISTPGEIGTLVAVLEDDNRGRPLFIAAIFTGLRASELRGRECRTLS